MHAGGHYNSSSFLELLSRYREILVKYSLSVNYVIVNNVCKSNIVMEQVLQQPRRVQTCLKGNRGEMTDSEASGLAGALCIHPISLLCHPYLEWGMLARRKCMARICLHKYMNGARRLRLSSSYYKSNLSFLFESLAG